MHVVKVTMFDRIGDCNGCLLAKTLAKQTDTVD